LVINARPHFFQTECPPRSVLQSHSMNERDLGTAVLVQAICELTGADGNRYHRATLRYFARLWFESDDHQPSSFNWICDQLELDASRLRRRVFEMADQKTKTAVSMHLVTTTRTQRSDRTPDHAGVLRSRAPDLLAIDTSVIS
jgi:hypothetical protein